MRVFYNCNLQGFWLNAAVVVIAENETEAAMKMTQALIQENLDQEVKAKDIIELLPEHGAVVVWNGDY